MIFVYPIGIPLMYASLLFSKREILKNDLKMGEEAAQGYPKLGYLKFLVDAYKPQYYYFELVETARRLLLASFIGIFPANSSNSATIGLLICFFFNWLFVETKPFKNDENSQQCINLSHLITLLFLAALIVKVDVTNENGLSNKILSWILICVLGAVPALMAAQSTRIFMSKVNKLMFKKNQNSAPFGGPVKKSKISTE